MPITALIARAPALAEMPIIFAQTAQKKPMVDLSGPNATVASAFVLLVGVIALVGLWQAIVNGKPKVLLSLLACVLLAGLIYRFTDINKIRGDNGLYTGIEDIGGIEGAPPATAPPATR
jgi:hypothetical protein